MGQFLTCWNSDRKKTTTMRQDWVGVNQQWDFGGLCWLTFVCVLSVYPGAELLERSSVCWGGWCWWSTLDFFLLYPPRVSDYGVGSEQTYKETTQYTYGIEFFHSFLRACLKHWKENSAIYDGYTWRSRIRVPCRCSKVVASAWWTSSSWKRCSKETFTWFRSSLWQHTYM